MPMAPYTRARIDLSTDSEIIGFIAAAQQEEHEFVIEDFSGVKRVSARSMLGMMYAVAEFDQLFLVNISEDGNIPNRFNQYRMLSNATAVNDPANKI